MIWHNRRQCSLVIVIFLSIHISKASDEELDLSEDSEIPVVEGFGQVKIPQENEVLVLNIDNFHHVIRTNDILLIEFYAPWCGHCKALEPEYAAAATELKKDGIRIAKVDVTAETDLASAYEITGYPTIKLFKKGEFSEDFDGTRTSTGIIEYMRKHADPDYTPPPSSVKVLTASNFSDFVASEKLSLVEFYAPWCGHCKQLAPEYEGAAQDLQNFKIQLAKVDGTVETSLGKEYSVTGYPKLLVFRHGRSYEYKGPRERRGIVSYMEEQSKLPSINLKTTLQSKNQIPRTDPCVIAYFDEENKMYQEYISAANQMRDESVFLHTFDTEVASKLGLSVNTVNILFPEIYRSKYEDKMKTFAELEGSESEMTAWIKQNIVPLVGHRTQTNMASKYSKRPLLIVYYDVNFSHQYVKATEIVRSKILPVANKYKEIIFAISNEEEYAEEVKSFGLDDSGEDVNVGIFGEENVKFRMEPEEDFDSEVLEYFVKKYKKGKLAPYMKSQPIPKKQEGPVRIIVANTFESEVMKTEKNVLIEFYAPWCGHCKKLEPVYKKVASYYATERPDLVVAKMDATANDVIPMFNIRGFPTIYLVKASDKNHPIPFEGGDRTYAGFKDFIEKRLPSSQSKDEL